MSDYACSQDRFLGDVQEHELTVIRDDGVDRHMRFRRPGTICMGFDLITWPGHLCYTGDMGTFVFRRLEDMFEFFREQGRRWGINPGYWSQKLLAVDRNGGHEEFSQQAFRQAIAEYFQNSPEEDRTSELWQEIEEEVLPCDDGAHEAMRSAMEFEGRDGFRFTDLWDCGPFEEFTFHFIWCCRALPWAIAKYDELPPPTPGDVEGGE